MSELIELLNNKYTIITKTELDVLRELQRRAEEKRLSRKEQSHKWFINNQEKHRIYCREKAREIYSDPEKRAKIRAYQTEYQKTHRDELKLKKQNLTEEQIQKKALYHKNYREAQKQKLIDQAVRLAELEKQVADKSKMVKKSIVI